MITDTQYCHAGLSTVWKVSKYGVFAGPYFSVFGLNTEIYGVNLRIQYEYGKMRIRKNSAFGNFSRSAGFSGIKQLEMLFVKQWRSKFKPFSFTIFILISLYTSKKKKDFRDIYFIKFIGLNIWKWTYPGRLRKKEKFFTKSLERLSYQRYSSSNIILNTFFGILEIP